MTNEEYRVKLRDAVQAMIAMTSDEWELQTSNSFRRIGTARGDGNILCATKQSDGHPDLLAAPGVLAYIIVAQPRAMKDLLDYMAGLEDVLDKLGDISADLGKIREVMHLLAQFVDKVATDEVVSKPDAQALIVKAAALLNEVKR